MPLETLDSENELLKKIAQGDEIAFSKLFTHYSNWVYATSFRLTESAELAEEIVQDVFLKLWLKRTRLTEIERFSDYLFIIARNHSFTAMKRTLRRQAPFNYLSETEEPADNTTDTHILYKDYQSILQEAISRLPPRQKEVYRLCKQEGLKREEAAERLGLSPHTVKIHLKAALLSIRAWCRAHIDLSVICFLLIWPRH